MFWYVGACLGSLFSLGKWRKKHEENDFFEYFFKFQATKAGLKIYRPGVKQDDENSGGWFSWIWSWSGEKKDEQKQEVKGSSMFMYWYIFLLLKMAYYKNRSLAMEL